MKVTQMPPVHAANLVVNDGNTAYGVDVIRASIFIHIYIQISARNPNQLNQSTALHVTKKISKIIYKSHFLRVLFPVIIIDYE